MLVSHKNKFVFIHTPKTGGDCITYTMAPLLLDKQEEDYKKRDIEIQSRRDDLGFEIDESEDSLRYYKHFEKHSTAKRIMAGFKDIGWDWEKYYKFGAMRNPYDIFHSCYYFHKYAYLKLVPDGGVPSLEKVKHIERYVPDDEYLRWLNRTYEIFNLTFTEYVLNFTKMYKDSIYEFYFCDDDKNLMVNRICRQENLQEDFNIVCKEIGLPETKLIKGITTEAIINKPRPDKKQDYSQYLIDYVAERFKKDLEKFDYKF